MGSLLGLGLCLQLCLSLQVCLQEAEPTLPRVGVTLLSSTIDAKISQLTGLATSRSQVSALRATRILSLAFLQEQNLVRSLCTRRREVAGLYLQEGTRGSLAYSGGCCNGPSLECFKSSMITVPVRNVMHQQKSGDSA